eukprot:c17210_g1_i2.p1 GENE.c17210_g1_i2~~c17210_g1_i2.p1  ORF type:complete len:536 (+),score=61.72 c17210_g1_i2:171-1778(+)
MAIHWHHSLLRNSIIPLLTGIIIGVVFDTVVFPSPVSSSPNVCAVAPQATAAPCPPCLCPSPSPPPTYVANVPPSTDGGTRTDTGSSAASSRCHNRQDDMVSTLESPWTFLNISSSRYTFQLGLPESSLPAILSQPDFEAVSQQVSWSEHPPAISLGDKTRGDDGSLPHNFPALYSDAGCAAGHLGSTFEGTWNLMAPSEGDSLKSPLFRTRCERVQPLFLNDPKFDLRRVAVLGKIYDGLRAAGLRSIAVLGDSQMKRMAWLFNDICSAWALYVGNGSKCVPEEEGGMGKGGPANAEYLKGMGGDSSLTPGKDLVACHGCSSSAVRLVDFSGRPLLSLLYFRLEFILDAEVVSSAPTAETITNTILAYSRLVFDRIKPDAYILASTAVHDLVGAPMFHPREYQLRLRFAIEQLVHSLRVATGCRNRTELAEQRRFVYISEPGRCAVEFADRREFNALWQRLNPYFYMDYGYVQYEELLGPAGAAREFGLNGGLLPTLVGCQKISCAGNHRSDVHWDRSVYWTWMNAILIYLSRS